MEQSPSWEASRFPAGQEIPRILWNPKVHYRIHKSPPLVSVVGKIKPVHVLPKDFFKVHLRLDLPSALFPSRFSTKPCMKLSCPPYVPQALAISFDQPDIRSANIIIIIIIMWSYSSKRPWRPRGVWRYSPTHSLTSALDGVGGRHHPLAALPTG